MTTDKHGDTSENKIKELGKEFISSIGINGLSKLLLKNKIRRNLWAIVVVFGFIAFFCHFAILLTRYWTFPVNSGDKLIEGAFVFPDVTFCSTQPYDRTKVTPEGLGIQSATHFWDYVYRDWVEDDQVRGFFADRCADTSFLYHARDRKIFVDLRDHIHFCFYNGEKCNPDDFSIVNLPERLNCLTFHPKKRTLKSTGPKGGLRLIMSKGPGFSYRTMYEEIIVADGFNVIIHDNGTIPDKSRKTFFIESGVETEIAMELKQYNQLNTPVNPCREEDVYDIWTTDVERDPSTFLKYKRNRDTCRLLSNQKKSIDDCQCWRDDEMTPWNNPDLKINSRNYPLCHMIDDRFFYNEGIYPENKSLLYKGKNWSLDEKIDPEYASLKNRALCFQNLSQPEEPPDHIPSCIHACTQLNYVVTKSEKQMLFNFNNFIATYYHFFNKFRITPINKQVYRNVSYFREELGDGKNVVSIRLFASDLSVLVTSENLAYPLNAFMSDFGGNFGLWIGISLIGALEILDLIIRMIYIRINYSSKKDSNRPKETEMENLKA